jgi:sugar/nucleoside kinase (ribokinase family)
MVQSKANTVADYLAQLPAERRQAIEAVRAVILENLPTGYEESMQFGMIGYAVPLSRYPKTYNGAPLNYAALASQKNHMAVYLMGCYGDEKLARWFETEFEKAGKKLDMGKSCVRFKKLDDLPLDLIGEAVARMPVDDFIALYERTKKGIKRK